MDKRLIEFTEPYKANGQEYDAGSRMAFPKDQADRYIDMGIAKDPETGEQGERRAGVHAVKPENVAIKSG